MKKFVTRLTVFLLVFFMWSHYRLDGFQIYKIKANHSNYESGDESSFEGIKNILSQKFHYLGKGRQCFVFVSEDEDYVIKLINQQRFELLWQLRCFTFIPYLKKLQTKRYLRREPSLKSYQIADNFLKEETGILYVKMGNKSSFHQTINLKDKTGKEHKIDLLDVDIVLQKKVQPIYPYLIALYKENKSEFKKAINSFLEIMLSRIRKNIIDDDLDVQINYGFLKGRAILIDPGRLCIDNSLFHLSKQKAEMLKSTKKFRKWIEKNYPDMLSFFDETLSSKFES